MNQFQEENKRLREQLRLCEIDKKIKASQISKLQQDVSTIQKQYEEMLSKVLQYQGQKAELDSAILKVSEQQKTISELQQKYTEQSSIISTQEEKIMELQMKLEDSKSAVQSKEAAIIQLTKDTENKLEEMKKTHQTNLLKQKARYAKIIKSLKFNIAEIEKSYNGHPSRAEFEKYKDFYFKVQTLLAPQNPSIEPLPLLQMIQKPRDQPKIMEFPSDSISSPDMKSDSSMQRQRQNIKQIESIGTQFQTTLTLDQIIQMHNQLWKEECAPK